MARVTSQRHVPFVACHQRGALLRARQLSRRLGPVTVKEQLRSLVDDLDDGQALALLRERYPQSGHVRHLPVVGTLQAEPDCAERADEILRDEIHRNP